MKTIATCKICKIEFVVGNGCKGIYCSRVCRYQDSELKENLRLSRIGCKHTPESRRKMAEARKHQSVVRNQYTKGGKQAPGKSINCVCGTCNKVFHIYPSELKKGMGEYCSVACRSNGVGWLEKNRKVHIGQVHPMKGKKYPWSKEVDSSKYCTYEWKQLRSIIYARDNWTCQECGKKTTNLVGKDKICCHHVDYNTDNTNQDNLITLCWSCHGKTNFNRPFWTTKFSTERNTIWEI